MFSSSTKIIMGDSRALHWLASTLRKSFCSQDRNHLCSHLLIQSCQQRDFHSAEAITRLLSHPKQVMSGRNATGISSLCSCRSCSVIHTSDVQSNQENLSGVCVLLMTVFFFFAGSWAPLQGSQKESEGTVGWNRQSSSWRDNHLSSQPHAHIPLLGQIFLGKKCRSVADRGRWW